MSAMALIVIPLPGATTWSGVTLVPTGNGDDCPVDGLSDTPASLVQAESLTGEGSTKGVTRRLSNSRQSLNRGPKPVRARSSVGEHHIDTVGVVGSIPTVPTMLETLLTPGFFHLLGTLRERAADKARGPLITERPSSWLSIASLCFGSQCPVGTRLLFRWPLSLPLVCIGRAEVRRCGAGDVGRWWRAELPLAGSLPW
jgi:hypothetical protein